MMADKPGARSTISNVWLQPNNSSYQQQSTNASTWEGACHHQNVHSDDPNYGRPVPGSMTEYRGMKAGQHITREIFELCEIISRYGARQSDDSYDITFGNLFDIYTSISNKLVGMLMRARRMRLLTFKGEMLFQRRDDDVIIKLFKYPP